MGYFPSAGFSWNAAREDFLNPGGNHQQPEITTKRGQTGTQNAAIQLACSAALPTIILQ